MPTEPALVELSLRSELVRGDRESIRDVVAETGFFSPAECEIALELVDERLRRRSESGYSFVIAEHEGAFVGYACYGAIPGTRSSYDLYWIVVAPGAQRKGVGLGLLRRVEWEARQAGAERMWVDTSGRPQYGPTRDFYARAGYERVATLPSFYAPGDDKVIFVKPLDGGA